MDNGVTPSGSGSQASPEAAGASSPSVSIPNAGDGESIEDEIARNIALHGLGTVSGHTRLDPPTEEWDRSEWRRRILEVIPVAAEYQCRELARDIMKAILKRPTARAIDDGIRTAPRYAAEQIRKLNPGMQGLIFNLDRLSDVLDTFAVMEVAAASGMSAGTAETAQQAQGEARQPGPKGDAQ